MEHFKPEIRHAESDNNGNSDVLKDSTKETGNQDAVKNSPEDVDHINGYSEITYFQFSGHLS